MVFQLQGEAVAAVINASRSRAQTRTLLDLAGILERALDDCLELTGSNVGYVDLLNADGHRELAAVKGADVDGAFVKSLSGLAVHANLANAVILKRQIKISNDFADDRDSVGVPSGHPPVKRVMGAPLVAGDAVLGMVVVANKRGEYTPEDAGSFSIFANQLAVAIAYSRLYEQQLQINAELERLSTGASDRAASDERQRLARELHDSAAQSLYGIALATQAVRRTVERDLGMARLAEPLDYILQLAEVALAELRALIFGLRPESLAEEGLIVGLQRLTAAVAARHKLTVDLVANAEPDLDIRTKEALYRIAQEAIQNVVKHASARSVEVQLIADRHDVELRIADDGVGFEPGADYPGHIGLNSMKERAHALNLELTVDSHPGAGVQVKVRTHALPRHSARVLPWS
jgi:signal transduction histidine kinase